MEFIVDRSRWVCGSGDVKRGLGEAEMKNDKGFMCCLGHCARQLGSVELIGRTMPSHLARGWDIDEIFTINSVPWGSSNSTLSLRAVDINDDDRIDQKEREKQLRALFIKYGHKIKFTGKSVKP